MPWSAIGGGIGGLVRRVHGRKDRLFQEEQARKQWREEERVRQEQWARDDNQLARMAADARRAGIHPLAALGQTSSSGTFGPSAMPIDFGDSGGREIGEAVAEYGRYRQRKTEEANEATMRAAQIKVLESEARRNDAAALAHQASVNARIAQNANASQDKAITSRLVGEGRGDMLVGPLLAPTKVDKKFSDAEDWETRYGDIAQNIEGTALYVRERGGQAMQKFQNWLDGLIYDAYDTVRDYLK